MRAIVSGYYGSGNAGDEALLAGIVAGMREAAGDVHLTVLSRSPAVTANSHGVESIGSFDARALRRQLDQANLLISGGGNLFQDTTSARSCLYYLAIVEQALKARVPVMVLGQGIGPLRRRWLRALVRRYLNRVQGIAVRDSRSARELARMRVTAPTVRIAADLSLAMDPCPPERVAAAYRDVGVGEGEPVLAVAPRTWRIRGMTRNLLSRLASAVKDAMARVQPNGRAVLFPMQRPRDVEPCGALAEALGGQVVAAEVPPPVLAGMLGRARAVVGMRLHALIFAAAGGAPPVAVSYDPKVDAFMADLALDVAASASRLDEAALTSAIVEAWNAQENQRASLRGVMEDRRQVVRDVFRWATQVARQR
ncbi:MAG: polysaccharide pyruvyl transferase CsaB [Armatimonadota bacterium]|nr:MAG: polysaccharide pyruvyl transferase CsaB [Armatimonadota bacterium]